MYAPRGHSSQQLSAPVNRSYDVEYSDTRPIIELKLRSAGPVLRTEMTREAPVTIVLPFFCRFNYVYALNYPLRLEWARLTQKRARTARAAVGPNPSLACPRPRFEVRKRLFLPVVDRRSPSGVRRKAQAAAGAGAVAGTGGPRRPWAHRAAVRVGGGLRLSPLRYTLLAWPKIVPGSVTAPIARSSPCASLYRCTSVSEV